MSEVWLKPNLRAVVLALIPIGALEVLGILLVVIARDAKWATVAGVSIVCLSTLALGGVLLALGRPRLAYRQGKLLVRLRSGAPESVPIEVVECFLLGRGPSFLPGSSNKDTEATTLVVRLREPVAEWEHRETDRRLGTWCGHHITIRGAWCEPLDVGLATRLNARLAEAQKQAKLAEAS